MNYDVQYSVLDKYIENYMLRDKCTFNSSYTVHSVIDTINKLDIVDKYIKKYIF